MTSTASTRSSKSPDTGIPASIKRIFRSGSAQNNLYGIPCMCQRRPEVLFSTNPLPVPLRQFHRRIRDLARAGALPPGDTRKVSGGFIASLFSFFKTATSGETSQPEIYACVYGTTLPGKSGSDRPAIEGRDSSLSGTEKRQSPFTGMNRQHGPLPSPMRWPDR